MDKHVKVPVKFNLKIQGFTNFTIKYHY